MLPESIEREQTGTVAETPNVHPDRMTEDNDLLSSPDFDIPDILEPEEKITLQLVNEQLYIERRTSYGMHGKPPVVRVLDEEEVEKPFELRQWPNDWTMPEACIFAYATLSYLQTERELNNNEMNIVTLAMRILRNRAKQPPTTF